MYKIGQKVLCKKDNKIYKIKNKFNTFYIVENNEEESGMFEWELEKFNPITWILKGI